MQVIKKLIEERLIERFDRSILIFLSSNFTRRMCALESKLDLIRLFETFTETKEWVLVTRENLKKLMF